MAEIKQLDYSSLLYAYALGCLDKDDYIKLIEYLSHSKDFPWQELGEYQNLAALLPSFLNIEEPPNGLKDRVARKLYRLRDTKPVVKKESAPPAMPAAPAKAKTMLTEKMKSTSVGIAAEPKTDSPSEAFKTSGDIVTPPEFKSSSPFSQRGGAGARPQQDTQVRSRSEQQAPDRDPYSNARDNSEQSSSNLPINESRFRGEATNEFIINQGFDDSSEDLKYDDRSDFKLNGLSIPNLEDDVPQIFKNPPSPASHSEPFASTTTLPPMEFEQNEYPLEDIRRKVVENVEKEQFVNPLSVLPAVETAKTPRILYALLVLLLLSIGGIYFLLHSEIKKLQAKAATTDQIAILNSDIAGIKKNASGQLEPEILAMLSKKDSKTVLLNGIGKFKDSYGKLIIDPKTKEGFIALGYFPFPLQDTEYILWITDGKAAHRIEYNRILTFSQESIKYTALKNVNELKGLNVKVLLTIEKKGSEPKTPSVQVCLEGFVK